MKNIELVHARHAIWDTGDLDPTEDGMGADEAVWNGMHEWFLPKGMHDVQV